MRVRNFLSICSVIHTCLDAKQLFLKIPKYADTPQCLAACEERLAALQKTWEELRATRALQEKKQKKACIITLSCTVILLLLIFPAYLLISRLAIPESQYKEALEMIEAGQYNDAIALLEEAKTGAGFEKTTAKIEQAIADAEAGKQRLEALREERARAEAAKIKAEEAKIKADKAKDALVDTIANGLVNTDSTTVYERAIHDLLKADVATHITYQREGGILKNLSNTVENYQYIYDTATATLPTRSPKFPKVRGVQSSSMPNGIFKPLRSNTIGTGEVR